MKKITFTKTKTRDCCILLEEIWHGAVTKGLEKFIGEKNPYDPPNIFSFDNGVLEIWENEKAMKWSAQKLSAIAKTNNQFVSRVINRYKKAYAKLEYYWKIRKVSSKKEIIDYARLFLKASRLFAVIYYLVTYGKTSKKDRALLFDLRTGDNLFDGSDSFLRTNIKRVIPETKGLDVVILRQEIKKGFQKETLKKRKKNWVFIPGEYSYVGKITDFALRYPNFSFKNLFIPSKKKVKKISGRAAFMGKTRGRVKIVRLKREISKVKAGDILVSPMTTPELVPAMKKAAAFVTDEGGTTCHAAIIARELKKPCIVGTKIASSVLKDNDLIEVDAKRGLVRILKSS